MNVKTKLKVTTGGAISLSTVATCFGICCVGPWAVTLYGVSGAVTLARLDVFRPYILIIAVLLLARSFWLSYRPAPSIEGSCREYPSAGLTAALWIAVILVLVAIPAEPTQ